MRSVRGSNLRAVPVAPGTEPESDGTPADLNNNDAMSINSGVDDLQNLPDAPKAIPVQPGSGTSTTAHDDSDLDALPNAGGNLGHIYDQVIDADPDHVAKVLDTSKKTGQDPAFVEANLKDAQKGANSPDANFFQSIENKFPGTTKFLQVPQNMAVAHDDIPNLAKHEQLVQGITQAMDLASSFKAGFQGSSAGLLSRGKLPDTELPPDAPIQNRLAAQAGGLVGDAIPMVQGAMVGGEAGGTAGVIIGSPLGIPGAAVGGFVGGVIGGGAGAFAAPAAIKEKLRLDFERGNIKGVADALDRAGLILNAATKQALVGGLTSAVGGAVAAPFESAAAKVLLPSVFENSALKIAAPLIAENVTMTKAGNAVEGKETNPEDYLDTALMIGAMHGATHFAGVAMNHYVEAKKIAQAVQFYDGLHEAGGASKLLTRLPEQYQAMLGDLTKDSPVENVHIPQEAFNSYFQSKNIDPAQAAEELGVTDAYNEAQKTGGNVTIPTQDFVRNVVKTEHYQGLKDDIKFDPEGFTVNEIKSHQAEIQDQIKQAESDAIENDGKPLPEESAQKIYDERYQQLIDAGRSESESEIGATLHSEAFKTLAERTGQDPYELAQKFQLEVNKREDPGEPVANEFQQSRDPGLIDPEQLKAENDHLESPTGKGDREFPGIHPDILKALGSEDKPVVVKENIAEKNLKSHPEIKPGENAQILRDALYSPDVVIQSKPNTKPNYYTFVKHDGKSKVSVIEVNAEKDQHEVVNWYQTDEKGIRKIQKRAEREGGQILMTPEANSQGAAALSALPSDTASVTEGGKKDNGGSGSEYLQGAGDNSPRGRISFGREKAVIDLFKDANRSTFLHESGHYFLEVMQHMAGEENAPQSLKDDMGAIRDWMGLKEGDEIGTAQHEQFARGFEAYLMEGKAPSQALRGAFAKFKQWLTHIYRSIKSLNVELSPDIRNVMDRMLATDDAIKQAHEAIGYSQKGLEVPAGVKPRIDNLAEQARDQAESTLMKEQMSEITTQHKQFLEATRKRLTIEAEQQVRKMPVYQAIEDIKEAVGKKKSVEGLAAKLLDGKLKDEDAVHFETAAEVYDFADGRELALNIINSKANDHFNEAVRERVERDMATHADLMNTGNIREQALKAVHNEKMTELLALERSILADKVRGADVDQQVSKRNRLESRIEAEASKDQAKQILDQKSIKDAGNARIYITAERNAAAKAAGAIAKKDFARATEYKRQQMLNHALASEAMRNRELSDKAVHYLDQAAKRGSDLKDMPYGFNRQNDQLLEKFGFKERAPEDLNTLRSIAKNMQDKGEDPLDIANATGQVIDPTTGQWKSESLTDFVTRVNDNYVGLQLPDSVLNGQGFADFRDMKMSDLRDLQNSVKMITDAGKKYDRFLNDFIKVDMKAAAFELKKSVTELIGAPYAENRKLGAQFDSEWRQRFENLKNLPDSMIPTLVNTLTLCHYLDGGEQGPAHEYIYRPMKQAEDRKFARYAKMREDLTGKDGLLGQFYTPKELADYKKEATKYDGRSITKENILSMALNWGNESNRDRIRAGFGARDESGRLVPLPDSAIEGLFKHLGKKDWDFAQATWKHLDTYWPEVSALEMKMRGVEPNRVEPSAFTNEHGTYEGGYYPIAYDFEKASEAFKSEQAKNELYKQYSAASAQTESGHTQARTSFVARPIRLSMDVLFNHLENVIHDLEFRPAVVDTSKFLAMPDVKTTLENAIGMPAKRGLDTWLKSIASDQSENLTWIEKALTWSRFGATISQLGLTPKAFLLHMPSNIFNAMWETGVMNTTSFMTRASLDVAMGRGNLKDFVFEKSERMKQRLTVRDRDIMDMSKAWQGTSAGMIPHFAFMSLHLADEAVSVPLWADVYKKNVGELGERGAMELADETVTRTLGSGSKVDQINLQRGGGAKKLFTMFYSWMSVMFNRAWLDGKMAGLEYKQGNTGTAAAILAKGAFFAWALPAVHEALLKEALHNGPTTDDERKKRIAGTLIEHPFSMIPFVRDIAGPAIHKAMGEQGGDYRMSPVETAYQNLYSPLSDGARIAFTDNKQFDEHYAEEAARGMAQAAGYPQQLNTWAFNFWDYVEGNGEASIKQFLQDLASRRKKK